MTGPGDSQPTKRTVALTCAVELEDHRAGRGAGPQLGRVHHEAHGLGSAWPRLGMKKTRQRICARGRRGRQEHQGDRISHALLLHKHSTRAGTNLHISGETVGISSVDNFRRLREACNEIRRSRSTAVCSVHLGGDGENQCDQLFLVEYGLPADQQEECDRRVGPHSFVSVDKWVILAEMKKVRRCHRRNGGVQDSPAECRLGRGHG